MKLSEETKQEIIDEYNSWVDRQYAGKTREERDALGAFFTPPEVTIKMLEGYNLTKDLKESTILDPTIGAGGLIVACIIAGADPKKCYGNEYDPDILNGCKERLCAMGVPEENLHQGDANFPECVSLSSFTKDYSWDEIQIKHGLKEAAVSLW